MKVSVVSDVCCPWCFIGYRNLQAAAPKARAKWLPYIVNPKVPPEGIALAAYYQKHWGVPLMALKMSSNPMMKAAKAVNLQFNWDRKVVNSTKANTMVTLALNEGVEKQNKVVDTLFTRYFLEAQDISNDEVLATIAKDCGLDQWFSMDSAFIQEVEAMATKNREAYKSGVPHFTIETRGGDMILEAPTLDEMRNALEKLT